MQEAAYSLGKGLMPHLEVPQCPCPRILHLASQLQALALGPAVIHFIFTFMFIFIFIKFRPFVEPVPQPSSCAVLPMLTPEHMSQLDCSARAQLSPHD